MEGRCISARAARSPPLPAPGAGSAVLEHRATAGTAGGEFSAGGLPDFGLALDQRLDEPYALVHTARR